MGTQISQKDDNETLKMAVAVAILKSKLLLKENLQSRSSVDHNPGVSTSNSQSEETSLKWKRKAKERKQQILRLKEELKIAEDGLQYDLFPQNASCKCYFFDDMGVLGGNQLDDSSNLRFNDLLRRRFFRQVRIKDRRRKRDDAVTQERVLGSSSDNEIEQLSASVDFLVELFDTVSPAKMEEKAFKNWSHQAVDFILSTLKTILPLKINLQTVEGIVNSLIMRLLRRMCNPAQGDDCCNQEVQNCDTDIHFCVQHLIRKLGNDPYLGQRAILSVSQGISTAAESLIFMDPFDDAFRNMHTCLYMMIQLIEFLVSDNLMTWSTREDFEMGLFEEWLSSILRARKALEALENRSTLYVLYMDRVIGDVAKKAGQSSFYQRLNPNILSVLFS
ncbi:OLC1v1035495C1 [Oldenlandia corymbosa var. corymbosa]|uniref:OLC1v1035495C1 n=1 Tax=Oldenlandia corymbosa var. corymbosa TaxID=529605 RepID=A0AAV1CW90_OLDCO|nr:OLC1v1035495C1 [Oldenlandia corymbosa var. corymbosa]